MNKWIDKKRKKLIVNTSKVKQRFGIRKLTTGVTSVLLGAFLIWGGAATAQAAEGTPTNDNEESSNISNDSSNIKDVKEVTLPASQESADKTNVAPSTTNSPQEAEQPAPTTINEKKSDKAVVQSSNVANKEDESANKDQDYEDKQSSILKIQNNQQINSNILKKNLTESKVEDSLKDFHFTGAISSFKNTTAGKDENYLTFKDGDTAEIAYQIQGFGGTGSKSGFFMIHLIVTYY